MDNLNTKYTCTCCGAEVSLEQLNDFNCPKCGNIIEKAQKEYEEKYGKNEDKEKASLYKGVPGYSQSTYKKDINKTFIELSLSLIGVGLSLISLFFNNWLGLILFCVYLLLKDIFFLNLSKYEENIIKNFRKKIIFFVAIVALAGIFMIYGYTVLGSCNGPDKICFNNTGKVINQIIVIVTELALVVLSGFYFVYDFILENSLRNLKNEKDKLSFATCIASSVLLVLFFVGTLIAFFVQAEESRVLYAIPALIFGLAYIGIKLFYLIKTLKKN